ncbi:hypothetical protein, partial [Lachnobacterium bovis]|uniref:hypothetical protein n=1 Tax=Lachnobacterium bovis TaxID=140626 RepID=UPI001A9A2D2C
LRDIMSPPIDDYIILQRECLILFCTIYILTLYWYKDEKEIKVYGLSFAEVKKIAKKGVSKNMSNSELIKYMEVCREVEKYIGTQSSNTLATKITKEKNKIEENLGF